MALFGKKKKKGAEDEASLTPMEEPAKEEVSSAEEVPAAAPKLKVRPDVYTLLLGLSVAALVIASVLLYLNMADYGSSPLSGIPKA